MKLEWCGMILLCKLYLDIYRIMPKVGIFQKISSETLIDTAVYTCYGATWLISWQEVN